MANSESTAVQIVKSAPFFETWKGPVGSMRLEWTTKGAVLLMVREHGHAGYVPAILKRWNDALSMAPKIVVLIDFWDMTNYDASFFGQTQAWGARRRSQLEKVYLLTRSKLVGIGASAANVALGGMIDLPKSKEEFDRSAALHGFPVAGAA